MQAELTYRGTPGQHISHAAADACDMAAERAANVTLEFNDVRVSVSPGQSAESVVNEWQHGMAAAAVVYRASPVGKRAASEAQDRLNTAQVGHDRAMIVLPVTFENARAAIAWLQSFSRHADHNGIFGTNFGRVADVLEASGWEDSEACGLSAPEYQKPSILGRWIIGQAIDMLRKGLPPHPVLMDKFAGQYLALTERT